MPLPFTYWSSYSLLPLWIFDNYFILWIIIKYYNWFLIKLLQLLQWGTPLGWVFVLWHTSIFFSNASLFFGTTRSSRVILYFPWPNLGIQRRQWQPMPVFLPGKSHGWRSLVGWSPWGRKESEATEWLHFHFSLSCIGEGNGNLLQCSCLENLTDGGAWWAAIYGVAQSRTRLKWLSSSSSSSSNPGINIFPRDSWIF